MKVNIGVILPIQEILNTNRIGTDNKSFRMHNRLVTVIDEPHDHSPLGGRVAGYAVQSPGIYHHGLSSTVLVDHLLLRQRQQRVL